MADFRDVIKLYRAAGRPPISGGAFSYAGNDSPALQHAISRLSGLPPTLGRFEEEPHVDSGDLSFTWQLASHESARFYQSLEELVQESNALSNGIQPANFYLIENDYADGETPAPLGVEKAFRICETARLLSKLAFSHRSEQSRAQYLLFVLPAGEGKPPRTIELKTRATPAMLALADADIQPLRDLLSDKSESSIHVQEHRQLFRLSIADILSEDPTQTPTFEYLYEAWPRLLERYALNADCYVHKFSFEKLRQEIASTGLEFTTRLSKVLSDSATKMLALPLSVAAIVAVHTADSLLASTLSVVGSLLLSLLLAGVLHNQLLELRRVRQSFNVVVGPLEKKASDSDLKEAISSANAAFIGQAAFLARVLWTVRVLSWAPTIGALVLYAWRYSPAFRSALM